MKKHTLLKILGILLMLILITSYILVGRHDTIDRIGLADLLLNYFSIVLPNFGYIVLFVLSVGGFYGVLNKTASYKKLLDNIVTKIKPFGKKFIYLIIILFALITAFTGITIPLFIFIPFIASIIILMGYDKLVALTSTVVSIVVGYIGGIFVNFINPSTYASNTFEKFVGLDNNLANTFPKLLLLFAGIALLIYYVSSHIKNVEEKKVKYELTDDSELLISEVKGNYKDIKTWPLILILSLTFVIVVLGLIPWKSLFEINAFSNFHDWLLGLSIKKFAVFANIISANLPALGSWTGSGNELAIYVYISMLLVFISAIISLLGKIKVDDAIDNFVEGCKKMLPTAILITVAYTVLICSYNNGFIESIINNYGKFNFGISSLIAFLGCIINVDTTWIVAGVFSPIVNLITDESIYSSVAILLQGIYGIFMLIGPTSIILIIGLSYMDVQYTTWVKYIWRFILYLIILVAVVTAIVVLL